MRTLLMGVTPWVVSLAACLSASAQNQDRNQNRERDRDQTQTQGQTRNDNDRHAGKQETIRGVIAGVTVAGEMAINYRSNRAEAVEMSYLTIVGSPEHGKMSGKDTATARTGEERRDRDRDRGERSSMAGRHRHNVYIVWLTPNTKVCEANQSGSGQANARDSERGAASKPRELSWEQLEVGDHVEVTFTRREGTDSTASGPAQATSGTATSRKHGRHRTYFGDAVSITILPESQSQHYGYSPDQGRGERSGSDKDRSDRSNADKDRNQNR